MGAHRNGKEKEGKKQEKEVKRPASSLYHRSQFPTFFYRGRSSRRAF
jgi:hypothetical protein